jgi:hypothetical protein
MNSEVHHHPHTLPPLPSPLPPRPFSLSRTPSFLYERSQVRKEFEVADANADGFLVEEEVAQVGDASGRMLPVNGLLV